MFSLLPTTRNTDSNVTAFRSMAPPSPAALQDEVTHCVPRDIFEWLRQIYTHMWVILVREIVSVKCTSRNAEFMCLLELVLRL